MLTNASRIKRLLARIKWYAEQSDLREIGALQDDQLEATLREAVGYLFQGRKTLEGMQEAELDLYGNLILHKVILELCYDGAVHNAEWFTMVVGSNNASLTDRFDHYMQIIGQLENSIRQDRAEFGLNMPVDVIEDRQFTRDRPGRSDQVGGPFFPAT